MSHSCPNFISTSFLYNPYIPFLFPEILYLLVLYVYSKSYIIYIYFNKMKKEVGMLLQKQADTRAVGIYKLYEENTH